MTRQEHYSVCGGLDTRHKLSKYVSWVLKKQKLILLSYNRNKLACRELAIVKDTRSLLHFYFGRELFTRLHNFRITTTQSKKLAVFCTHITFHSTCIFNLLSCGASSLAPANRKIITSLPLNQLHNINTEFSTSWSPDRTLCEGVDTWHKLGNYF